MNMVAENGLVQMVEWFDDHFYKVSVSNSNGDMNLKDGFKDIYIPSVTTKLGATAKPFLIRWYGDLGNTEAERRKHDAAERGSRLHHAYHVFKTNGAVVYQPFERPVYTREELNELDKQYEGNIAVLFTQDEMYQLYKLQKLYEVLKPEVIHSEKIVYSVAMMDAGTVDDIWKIKAGEYMVAGSDRLVLEEGLYINDLKTGKEIDDDAFMQTAAYLKLAEDMGLGRFKGTLITHTNAKTKKGIEGLCVYHRTPAEVERDYADYRHVAAIWERKFSGSKPKIFEFPSLITLEAKEK